MGTVITAPPTGLEPAFLHAAVQERISQLWIARQMYRLICGAEWTTARFECETELRALLRLARAARRRAEAKTRCNCEYLTGEPASHEQADPITVAKGYRDWTEAEMAYAAGR